MLIYVHGFRSSPQSFKAQMLAQRMAKAGLAAQYACPALPVSPREAIELLNQQFSLAASDTLVGSSLGGYYATWLAEQTGCRAILLNPAIFPARDLAPYVGPLRTYHDDQPMEFKAEYLDELNAISVGEITRPERYCLIAAKGDEVLDWQEMTARYPASQTRLIEGSDHGLSDFDDHIDTVFAFAGLKQV
ncbi:MAG: YqiA/YcfP family alpha/beta fold hydrolase [Burkholderiaceae bacterium]